MHSKGLSLVEMALSLVILLVGVIAIINFFPFYLRLNRSATDLTTAAYLAQAKAEELRRDDYGGASNLIQTIETNAEFDSHIPSEGIAFSNYPQFSYSFSRRSQIDSTKDPDVARVIVRYSNKVDIADPAQGVIYELKFAK